MSKLVPLPEDRQSEILEEFTRLAEENKDIESLFKVLSDAYLYGIKIQEHS